MKNYTGQFLPMERPVFFHKYCYHAISIVIMHTQRKVTVI